MNHCSSCLRPLPHPTAHGLGSSVWFGPNCFSAPYAWEDSVSEPYVWCFVCWAREIERLETALLKTLQPHSMKRVS